MGHYYHNLVYYSKPREAASFSLRPNKGLTSNRAFIRETSSSSSSSQQPTFQRPDQIHVHKLTGRVIP